MGSVYQKEGRWVAKAKVGGRWKAFGLKCQSKTEAKRLLQEIERKAERQRLGLEPLPSDCTMTLAELGAWYIKNRCPEPSQAIEGSRFRKYVYQKPIGALQLPAATSAVLDQYFRDLEKGGLKPGSVNKLRAMLRSAFEQARRADLWSGKNPVADTEPRPVVKEHRPTLRADEVALVLSQVPGNWRNYMATALYTGGRKGDLCGLKRSDVDLETLTLTFARSYTRAGGKGGHVDTIPIAAPLVPYLRDAIAKSPSEWVFPGPDGKMRKKSSAPQNILRTALKKAGLLDGYEHVCRKCNYSESAKDGELRFCPKCPARVRCATCRKGDVIPCPDLESHERRKLWPRAIPRGMMKAHDLRHSTGTLLLRAGADAHRVQRVLRHKDIRTTLGTYGHLLAEDLREAVNMLPAGPETAPFGTPVVPDTFEGQREVGTAEFSSSESDILGNGRTRDRTWDTCRVKASGGDSQAFAAGPNTYQTLEETQVDRTGAVQRLTAVLAVTKSFGTPVVPAPQATVALPRPLLTVRQVAETLGVSTALVYALVNRGELAHTRVSNAIRVAPADLERYLRRYSGDDR
jgi:integrase